MKDLPESRSSLIWKFAIMGAMVMMLAPLLIFIIDANVVEYRNYLALLNIVILAGIIGIGVYTIRERALGGYITIGKGLSSGLLLTLALTFIYAVFNVIYYKMLAAGMVETMLEESRLALEERGLATSDIERSMKFTRAVFSIPGILFSTFLTFTLLGSFISVFVAILFQKHQKI